MPANFRQTEPSMWVGNVPSNTTEVELLTFVYNSVLHPYTISNAPSHIHDRLPLSVLLISYTNCAFVNFPTEDAVHAAIAVCNGKPLRPWDAADTRRLLCKERTQEQDLLSGVNLQRGRNMHCQWAARTRPHTHRQCQVNGVNGGNTENECDSTDSEALAEDYPVRYFILKSFTMDALNECLQTGIWRTQRHNERILDKAFRTSSEVILLFSANESKGFRCFGRMASRIQPERHEETSHSDQPAISTIRPEPVLDAMNTTVDDLALIPESCSKSEVPMIRRTKSEPTISTIKHPQSTLVEVAHDYSSEGCSSGDFSEPPSCELSFPCIYTSPTTYSGLNPHEFRIEWLCTSSVPFRKFSGLRNPWNHNKPIQVARDGIEIEPSAGRRVISRWRGACRRRSQRC